MTCILLQVCNLINVLIGSIISYDQCKNHKSGKALPTEPWSAATRWNVKTFCLYYLAFLGLIWPTVCTSGSLQAPDFYPRLDTYWQFVSGLVCHPGVAAFGNRWWLKGPDSRMDAEDLKLNSMKHRWMSKIFTLLKLNITGFNNTQLKKLKNTEHWNNNNNNNKITSYWLKATSAFESTNNKRN